MTVDVTYDPERWRRVHVDSAEGLRAVVPGLAAAQNLGVDLEMGQRVERKPGGQQEWIHVLALVQIASDSLSVVIDPLRCRDLSPLRPIMGGPSRKVFLGGGQDVALLEKAGIPARTIVDVGEIALAIFGRREDGMAALARRLFDMHLDKTVRRTDWLVRPLNPALLSYAYRDAELTLTIYYWLRAHFPEVVAAHEREHLDPPLPPNTPEWLRAAFGRQSGDAYLIAMEMGLDPRTHGEQLTRDVRDTLRQVSAPRMVNRLVRMSSDLGLEPFVPEIVPLATSLSSLVRASVARAIGRLATPEEAAAPLAMLAEDPIEEVRKAAAAAQKEVRKRPGAGVATPEDGEPGEEAASLDDDTRNALLRLLQQMESDTG